MTRRTAGRGAALGLSTEMVRVISEGRRPEPRCSGLLAELESEPVGSKGS